MGAAVSCVTNYCSVGCFFLQTLNEKAALGVWAYKVDSGLDRALLGLLWGRQCAWGRGLCTGPQHAPEGRTCPLEQGLSDWARAGSFDPEFSGLLEVRAGAGSQ